MARVRAAALTLLALVALGGCSEPVQVSGSTPTPMVPSTSAPAEPGSTSADQPGGGSVLGSKPVKHTVRSADLTVDVTYTPATPVSSWTAAGSKPLQVTATLRNRRDPKQKIYLARATVRFSASNGSVELSSPDPVTDSANINPGYLVTAPYDYQQSFGIPAVDSASTRITVDLKLELVALVDAKAKDYTKESVSDSVAVDLQQ